MNMCVCVCVLGVVMGVQPCSITEIPVYILLYIPAVDKYRPRLVFLHDSPVEGQDGCGIVWHSVVRPGGEVELSHFQRMI